MALDTLIKNVRIIDGSGAPWFRGSAGIKGGVIAGILPPDAQVAAAQTVDGQDHILSPGFIDAHTHGDLMLLSGSRNEIKLGQGVTSEICGNCGLAAAPLGENAAQLKDYIAPVLSHRDARWDWTDLRSFFDRVGPLAHNAAMLVGNGTIRVAVKGYDASPYAKAELDRHRGLLRECLEQGACGLSLGLIYAPDCYNSFEDLVAICKTLRGTGKPVTVHMRGEGGMLLRAVEESLALAQAAEVPLHISHFKAVGAKAWAMLDQAIERIVQARAHGLDVTADAYPYLAGATTLISLLPPWTLEGGIEKLCGQLRDPSIRSRIRDDLSKEHGRWDNIALAMQWSDVHIAGTASDPLLIGQTVAQVAQNRGVDPVDAFLDLIAEQRGKILVFMFYMRKEDIQKIISLPFTFAASDSIYAESGLPHPRLYGTFPTYLQWVREDSFMPLERMVRKMTSFPSARFNLGRGLIASGMPADLALWDENRIRANATFTDPRKRGDGVLRTWVAGKTDAFSGQILASCNSGGHMI